MTTSHHTDAHTPAVESTRTEQTPHAHEWEHIATGREGDSCTIIHGCEYCALLMITVLVFDGAAVKSVDVKFEDGSRGATKEGK